MADIGELLQSTTCACAVGMVVAEGIRAIFQRLIKSRSASPSGILTNLSDFVNSTLSAFVLVVCTFEKALTLWGDFRLTFFVFTFFLCIFYFFVFSSHAPSPYRPLEVHWNKISKSAYHRPDSKKSTGFLAWLRLPVMVYLEHALSTIFGLCLGLFLGIQWLKFFWNGYLTSHHMTSLPILDQCIDCLNTSLLMGVLLEASVTYFYLVFFAFVDRTSLPRDGQRAPSLRSKIFRSSVKSVGVVLATFLFMDITGSFANPFLAYALQRNCINDVTSAFNFTLVYVLGPFLATVAYKLQSGRAEKAKQSV